MNVRCLSISLMIMSTCVIPALAAELNPIELLGRDIFFDEGLSEPPGQSCGTCHGPEAGFAGPDSQVNAETFAYPGAVANRFSSRKPPTASYAGKSPILHLGQEPEEPGEETEYLFVGGMFFDGRAHGWRLQDPLAEQAQGPFLNPVEQNLPNQGEVVRLVRETYGLRFQTLFGEGALSESNLDNAYELIARVIAAYERSYEMNPYTSKYDFHLRGQARLTPEEQRGLALFEGKALCSECHPSQPGPDGSAPLFTDFTYDNLGVPRNEDLPFYDMGPEINPDGRRYADPGLGGFLATVPRWSSYAEENWGKHKVPTLRNVDARPYPDFVKVYMHNGVFKTLADVVSFYNTRDTADWPPAEVAANVNNEELGNLGLTKAEEAAIVAFMKTLTDGFEPEH